MQIVFDSFSSTLKYSQHSPGAVHILLNKDAVIFDIQEYIFQLPQNTIL